MLTLLWFVVLIMLHGGYSCTEIKPHTPRNFWGKKHTNPTPIFTKLYLKNIPSAPENMSYVGPALDEISN